MNTWGIARAGAFVALVCSSLAMGNRAMSDSISGVTHDLQIVFTAPANLPNGEAAAGQPIAFTVVVSNLGPDRSPANFRLQLSRFDHTGQQFLSQIGSPQNLPELNPGQTIAVSFTDSNPPAGSFFYKTGITPYYTDANNNNNRAEVFVKFVGGDKIKIESLSLVKSDRVLAGDATKIRLAIKNLTGEKLKIPHQILIDDVAKYQSSVDVLAGQTHSSIEVDWQAIAGSHRFCAVADPDNTLQEIEANRPNNSTLTGATVPCITVAVGEVEEKLLDYEEAKKWGAKFANNNETNECGIVTDSTFGPAYRQSIVFDCWTGPILGGKAKPEAFKDFKLQNSWKVKKFEWQVLSQWGGYRWLARPADGSDQPYMQILIWTDPFLPVPPRTEAEGTTRGVTRIHVKVFIRGPKGTNPYRIMFPGERPR